MSAAQDRSSRTLDIYVVDVEGGNATLFVSPSRQSLLIDTGNGGPAAVRDADRIMAAIKDAGLSQIDHLITTHYHGDHFGAMAEARRPDSDPRVHRSRTKRRDERGDRRISAERVSDALCERAAYRRPAGSSVVDGRRRRADRHRRWTDGDRCGSRRRQAEPVLCRDPAAGAQTLGRMRNRWARTSRSDGSARCILAISPGTRRSS